MNERNRFGEKMYRSECMNIILCPQFDPRIGFDSVCTGNQVWTSLCLLCRYSQAVLAKPHPRYMTEPHQYWVLKRVARHSVSNAMNTGILGHFKIFLKNSVLISYISYLQ